MMAEQGERQERENARVLERDRHLIEREYSWLLCT